jgi:hypothetical protein
MPANSGLLQTIANGLLERLGRVETGTTDDGVFVVLGPATVQVNLDDRADRAVLWVELERPRQAAAADLERFAQTFTAQHYLDDGLVMGVHREVDLILLGRSLERRLFLQDDGIRLMRDLASAAVAATAALALIPVHAGGRAVTAVQLSSTPAATGVAR